VVKLCILLSAVLSSKAFINQGLGLSVQFRNTFGSSHSQAKNSLQRINSPHWLQFVMLMCCYQNHRCKPSNWFTQANIVVVHEKLGAAYLMEQYVLGGSLSVRFNSSCCHECYK